MLLCSQFSLVSYLWLSLKVEDYGILQLQTRLGMTANSSVLVAKLPHFARHLKSTGCSISVREELFSERWTHFQNESLFSCNRNSETGSSLVLIKAPLVPQNIQQGLFFPRRGLTFQWQKRKNMSQRVKIFCTKSRSF